MRAYTETEAIRAERESDERAYASTPIAIRHTNGRWYVRMGGRIVAAGYPDRASALAAPTCRVNPSEVVGTVVVRW